MAPGRPNNAQDGPRTAPRRPQDGPRTPLDSPNPEEEGGAGWRAEVGGRSVGKAGGVVGMQGPCFEFRLKLFELVSSIAGLKRALSALGVLRFPPWYPLGSTVASARAFGEAVESTKSWKGTYEKFQQA